MKGKGIFAVLIASAIGAAAFIPGCTGGKHNDIIPYNVSDNSEGLTRIAFFGYKHEEPDLEAVETSLHNYMAENNGIVVTYEGLDRAKGYDDVLKLRYESGCLDDVFMLKKGELSRNMIKDKALRNLQSVIDLNAYSPLVQKQIQNSDGSVYFVPMALTCYCMYVNYALLRSDNQPVPTNYAEFESVCNFYVNKYSAENATKTDEADKLAPVICNKNRSLCTLAQGYGMFDLYQSENGEQIVEAANVNPDALCDNYLNKGIKFVSDALSKGWINGAKTIRTEQGEVGVKNGNDGDMKLFMQGKQPFMVTGGWATNRITDTEQGKNMDYGLIPFPILQDGSVLIFDIDVCVSVNANCVAKEETEEKKTEKLGKVDNFIKYFTKPESVWDFCNTNNSFSPLVNETRTPDNKTLEKVKDYFTNGRAVLGTDFKFETFTLMNRLNAVLNGICDGELDYAQACAKLKADIRAEINKNSAGNER